MPKKTTVKEHTKQTKHGRFTWKRHDRNLRGKSYSISEHGNKKFEYNGKRFVFDYMPDFYNEKTDTIDDREHFFLDDYESGETLVFHDFDEFIEFLKAEGIDLSDIKSDDHGEAWDDITEAMEEPHNPREITDPKEYRNHLLKSKQDPHDPFWNEMDDLEQQILEYTESWYYGHTGCSREDDEVVDSVTSDAMRHIFDEVAKGIINPSDLAHEEKARMLIKNRMLNVVADMTDMWFDDREYEEAMAFEYADGFEEILQSFEG